MQDYKINVQLLNALLNYLATKPFAEVHQVIGELQKLEVVGETESAILA